MSTTMKAQFNALLDPPGDLSLEGEGFSGYTLFVVLFHVICFFFMVNFLLAIIVDAYEQVQAANDALATEQDLVSDTVASICRIGMAIRHHWPRHYRISNYLHSLDLKFVNPPDLLDAGFRSIPDAEAWFHYYQSFDALVTEEKVDTSLQEIADSQMIALNRMEQLQKISERRVSMASEAVTPLWKEEMPMPKEPANIITI
eukprot:gnl/TRDRNA2_/TRDRNA2_162019_c0_seq3.p1 gnl/TRDRNA2_/TRDRNA2_162019_c0~~gnl/TRDRNA2_/TRDRNA2_162019_c0_seq3.p1  ORF type:complete len:223 (+),score=39.55 gnl/TRDRNA2_/TRDRNA2_162019_c0_seq3:68-670(+)